MKNPFFLSCLLVTVLTFPVVGQNREINFETGTWATVLEKAKAQNKLIMLDAYAVWCGPCKWMAKNIFTNDTVADFYNAGFINAKVDMEKGEGLDLAKRYEVKAYPTFLFINGNGDVVHRVCGSDQAAGFIETGKIANDPKRNLSGLKKRHVENLKDPKIAYEYFELASHACMNSKEELKAYFEAIDNKEYSQPGNWRILFDFVGDKTNPGFLYLVQNRSKFEAMYTADSVLTKISGVYRQELRNPELKNADFFKSFVSEVNQALGEKGKGLLLEAEMNHYAMNTNWNGYAKAAASFVELSGNDNPALLNSIAWRFYEKVEDKEMLSKAAGWAKRSTELDDKYYNNDTYAAVLFKLGRNADAEKAALKAIEIGKAAGEDVGDTEDLLKKIRALK
jgi:thiol-disulfide isomerase/thioredoxin